MQRERVSNINKHNLINMLDNLKLYNIVSQL